MSTKTQKKSRKSTKSTRDGNGQSAAKNGKAVLAAYEGDLDVTPVGPGDFEPEELRQVLRTMMLSRRLDDKMLTLLKQARAYGLGCVLHFVERYYSQFFENLLLVFDV